MASDPFQERDPIMADINGASRVAAAKAFDKSGVDPKDVDVRVENNVLTLRGERKWNTDVQRES